MADTTSKDGIAGQEPFQACFDMQGEAMREMLGAWLPGAQEAPAAGEPLIAPAELAEWARATSEIQALWPDFLGEQARKMAGGLRACDPAQWLLMAQAIATNGTAPQALAPPAPLAQTTQKK